MGGEEQWGGKSANLMYIASCNVMLRGQLHSMYDMWADQVHPRMHSSLSLVHTSFVLALPVSIFLGGMGKLYFDGRILGGVRKGCKSCYSLS